MPDIDAQIREHLPLADREARRAAMRGWRYDDCYSDALLGLWDALTKYDPARGEFARYAPRRIRGAIIDGHRTDAPHTRYAIRQGVAPRLVELDEWTEQQAPVTDPVGDWLNEQDEDERYDQAIALLDELQPRPAAMCRRYLEIGSLRLVGVEFGVSESRVHQVWKSYLQTVTKAA